MNIPRQVSLALSACGHVAGTVQATLSKKNLGQQCQYFGDDSDEKEQKKLKWEFLETR